MQLQDKLKKIAETTTCLQEKVKQKKAPPKIFRGLQVIGKVPLMF